MNAAELGAPAPGRSGLGGPAPGRSGLAGLVSAGADAAGAPDEPSWLADGRRTAWQLWDGGAMPDRALHLWRYTDPAQLMPDGFGARAAADVQIHLPEQVPAGVVACSLAEATIRHPALVRRWLGRVAADGESRWCALSSALWSGGAFIYVPRGICLADPIRVATRLSSPLVTQLARPLGCEPPHDSAAYYPRLLVVLETGAELSLVDEQWGDAAAESTAPCFVNAVTELVVGENARLRYAQVQGWPSRTHHNLVQRARVDKDGSLDAITVALGSRLSKADVGTALVGRGAATEMLGVVFGDGRQHFDHHTILDHAAPHTTSNLDFKVALSGRSASAYTGLLRIGKEGKKSAASQSARNLLLSDGARAEAIPELEILTDDVKASHGVAAGPLDAMLLFFCQSRGLSKREAVHTIVGGFFEPIISRVPVDEVRERLRAHVDAKLAAVDVDAIPAAVPSAPPAAIGGGARERLT